MKAPDKIYLQICGDCNNNDCENCKFEDLEDSITFCKDKIFEKDIEYTRTDAFIEKACEYAEKHFLVMDREIENFKNYMKGE